MQNTPEGLEAIVGSPSDREDLIVQIFTKESRFEVAQISLEEGRLVLEWFGRHDGRRTSVDANELAEVIKRARERLEA